MKVIKGVGSFPFFELLAKTILSHFSFQHLANNVGRSTRGERGQFFPQLFRNVSVFFFFFTVRIFFYIGDKKRDKNL